MSDDQIGSSLAELEASLLSAEGINKANIESSMNELQAELNDRNTMRLWQSGESVADRRLTKRMSDDQITASMAELDASLTSAEGQLKTNIEASREALQSELNDRAAVRQWQSGESSLDRQFTAKMTEAELESSMSELLTSLRSAETMDREKIVANMNQLVTELEHRGKLQDDMQAFEAMSQSNDQQFQAVMAELAQEYNLQTLDEQQAFAAKMQEDTQLFTEAMKYLDATTGLEQLGVQYDFLATESAAERAAEAAKVAAQGATDMVIAGAELGTTQDLAQAELGQNVFNTISSLYQTALGSTDSALTEAAIGDIVNLANALGLSDLEMTNFSA
jgi:uncharacterized MnhB-related membrane protein